MSTVRHVLERKHDISVACIDAEATVLEAAGVMNERRIGALVVTEGEKVIGIFTERDILNRIVAARRDPAESIVRNFMTAPVACCSPDTSVVECRSVMRARRVRHLPVVSHGRLEGIVSIGDVLEDEAAERGETIRYLYEYIYGGHLEHEPAWS